MMNRDKQIALMKIAASRQESPLKAWIGSAAVKEVVRRDPDVIAREGNGKAHASNYAGTMMLACA
ncbi:MAG TPA: hypothetical protein PKD10_07890 [Paracoccaceae bacterium]|nr:hypothetical protein [Paracoccaceae bacterium]HMO70661.1 hypothetical protein [Paracoccaceae bacterium]